ncbi:MAG: hypothetical protein [Wendovervirus sonii]|uniref:Uncharacterized protein n=1 Tax=phage Lak_Megaphage_Sonny TaxID=3109229 RepID=A0ABZ0Z5M2_9CAUD|nr:MAG: hypothetical protein [phage Lak_Megaphage_Sonny]
MNKKLTDLSNPASINDVNLYVKDDRLMIKKCEGHMRVIDYVTSRYGQSALPIFGVRYKYKEPGYPEYGYQIFVGEVPYKNKDGEWTTKHKVPTFEIITFKGSDFIDIEPDIPHIIRIQTDEKNLLDNIKAEKRNETNRAKINQLENAITYCSFSTYIKGLYNRITRAWFTLFPKKPAPLENCETQCPAR